jgi:choice-of-anchor A domain-containing protein
MAGWNAVAIDLFRLDNNDAAGRVVSMGDMILTGSLIGEGLPDDRGRIDILVGKDLSLTSGGTSHGRIAVVGRTRISDIVSLGGIRRTSAAEIDLIGAKLLQASHAWAGIASTGATAITPVAGGRLAITLTGKSADLNVFHVKAVDLENATFMDVLVPNDSTTLINVDGASVRLQSFELRMPDGASSLSTILHFPGAQSINLASSSIDAFVLAPLATVNHANSRFRGSVIARVIAGDSRFEYRRFSGCLKDSP